MSEPSKELEAYALELCRRYDRKCITKKCPLHKFYCYDFPNFRQLWLCSPATSKRNISRHLHRLMKDEGWIMDEQISQPEDDN